MVVLQAMKKFGIRRLVTISAFGVGDSNPNVFWPMRVVLNHSNMAFAYEDHNAVEQVMRKSKGVEWTLVRPVMLSDGPRGEVKVFGSQGKGIGMMPSVSRESVAGFVVERCLENREFKGETPVICD